MNSAGEFIEGELVASDANKAISGLIAKGLYPLSLVEDDATTMSDDSDVVAFEPCADTSRADVKRSPFITPREGSTNHTVPGHSLLTYVIKAILVIASLVMAYISGVKNGQDNSPTITPEKTE